MHSGDSSIAPSVPTHCQSQHHHIASSLTRTIELNARLGQGMMQCVRKLAHHYTGDHLGKAVVVGFVRTLLGRIDVRSCGASMLGLMAI